MLGGAAGGPADGGAGWLRGAIDAPSLPAAPLVVISCTFSVRLLHMRRVIWRDES